MGRERAADGTWTYVLGGSAEGGVNLWRAGEGAQPWVLRHHLDADGKLHTGEPLQLTSVRVPKGLRPIVFYAASDRFLMAVTKGVDPKTGRTVPLKGREAPPLILVDDRLRVREIDRAVVPAGEPLPSPVNPFVAVEAPRIKDVEGDLIGIGEDGLGLILGDQLPKELSLTSWRSVSRDITLVGEDNRLFSLHLYPYEGGYLKERSGAVAKLGASQTPFAWLVDRRGILWRAGRDGRVEGWRLSPHFERVAEGRVTVGKDAASVQLVESADGVWLTWESGSGPDMAFHMARIPNRSVPLPPKFKTSVVRIPKLSLGRGSIALVRGKGMVLEILDPTGKQVARFEERDTARSWRPVRWSPSGDALLAEEYGDGASYGLRVLDFGAGEDRRFAVPWNVPWDFGGFFLESTSARWLGPDRIWFGTLNLREGFRPISPWTAGAVAGDIRPFTVRPPRTEGPVNLAEANEFRPRDVTPDGGTAILELIKVHPENGNWGWSAAGLMDLGTGRVTALLPEGQAACGGVAFSRDGRELFLACRDRRDSNDGLITFFRSQTEGTRMEELVAMPASATGRLNAVSPDGRWLALVRLEGPEPGILLFDVAKRKLRLLLPLKYDVASGWQSWEPVGFTPDGKRFLALEVPESERIAEYRKKTLYRIDLASGARTVIAENLNDAGVAR